MQPFTSLLFTGPPPDTMFCPPTITIPAKFSNVLLMPLLEMGTCAGAVAIPAFANGRVPTSNQPVAVTTDGLEEVCIELCVPYATTRFVAVPAAFRPPAIENWKLNSVEQ